MIHMMEVKFVSCETQKRATSNEVALLLYIFIDFSKRKMITILNSKKLKFENHDFVGGYCAS